MSINTQMMQDLWYANSDGRLHITSNRSVYKRVDAMMPDRYTLKARVLDASFSCVVTVSSGVVLHLDGKPCACIVKGGSIGGGGVWLQIETSTSDFWLDVRALVPTCRQSQERESCAKTLGFFSGIKS